MKRYLKSIIIMIGMMIIVTGCLSDTKEKSEETVNTKVQIKKAIEVSEKNKENKNITNNKEYNKIIQNLSDNVFAAILFEDMGLEQIPLSEEEQNEFNSVPSAVKKYMVSVLKSENNIDGQTYEEYVITLHTLLNIQDEIENAQKGQCIMCGEEDIEIDDNEYCEECANMLEEEYEQMETCSQCGFKGSDVSDSLCSECASQNDTQYYTCWVCSSTYEEGYSDIYCCKDCYDIANAKADDYEEPSYEEDYEEPSYEEDYEEPSYDQYYDTCAGCGKSDESVSGGMCSECTNQE